MLSRTTASAISGPRRAAALPAQVTTCRAFAKIVARLMP
jgi:hypothetical protein